MEFLQKRHRRVRKKIKGTAQRPRLSVHKSNKHIYAQVIDDESGRTLAFVSTLSAEIRTVPSVPPGRDSSGIKGSRKLGVNKESAQIVGKLIGEKAVKAGIKKVVFDRGGHFYHGRVKTLAEAARKAGLQF